MNVLMVCTGGYCRSQIARAMYLHHIALYQYIPLYVRAKGITSWGEGRSPAPKVLRIIKERTATPQWYYTPSRVRGVDVEWARRIYVMEFAHEEYFMHYYPEHIHKVKLLSELAGRREEIFNPHYDNDDQLQIAANIIGYYIAKGCGSIFPPVQLTGDE